VAAQKSTIGDRCAGIYLSDVTQSAALFTKPGQRARARSGLSFSPSLLGLCGAVFLASTVAITYWPALSGDFVLDDRQLMSSELITSPDGLGRIWFTAEGDDFWPVTSTTFWVEWRLWGLRPAGYHVVNVVLHIAACLLLWRILNVFEIPGAFLAALLFAVHPVNVESVAWIAQRKNTLAMVFFLLSILSYLRFDLGAPASLRPATDTHRRPAADSWWYWLSLAAGLLAMLSKGSVIILPAVLLLLIWWRRPVTWSDALRLAPFCVLAMILTYVNMWFQTHGREIVLRDVTFAQRLAGAGGVVWFYLAKALAPVRLSFLYPQWEIHSSELVWWLPLAAAIVITGLLAWKRDRRWGRPLLLAWAFVCVALLPVMGFTDVGYMKYSLVADHYQHIALIGVVALVAAACAHYFGELAQLWRILLASGVALIAGILAYATWTQSALYGGPIPLYTAALVDHPGSWVAHNEIGRALTDSGKFDEAIGHFEQSLQLKPDYVEAENNLAAALSDAGRFAEASQHYQKALKLKPNSAEAYANFGNALARAGDLQAALARYETSLRLNPKRAETHNDYGFVLARLGQTEKAIEEYRAALALDLNMALAHKNLGDALLAEGQKDEANQHFEIAIRLYRQNRAREK
jgi:protein O-mannosyl-transferase